jgi:hypothetical protein
MVLTHDELRASSVTRPKVLGETLTGHTSRRHQLAPWLPLHAHDSMRMTGVSSNSSGTLMPIRS